MQVLTGAEIRERYLRFFEGHGHKRLPSDSLIPANDTTLLFTGAGMNQFKDMFLGRGSLPYRRVTTAQKCLRVPDLDEVGCTPRHHTFFEMLGNFSFGDYFKDECIAWEWEFFTRVLGIPAERLVVTIYQDDDEAEAIWRDQIGLGLDRIFRFGEKENFWPAEAPSKGPDGPCGPCSEIYYDATPDQPQVSKQGLRSLPGARYTEIGNCVFTQFDRQADGRLPPLPQRNIDVGLGLERITAVLAGARTNFDTDLFAPYLDFLQQRSGKRYGTDQSADQRMRRISDHARAVTFCIADGAVPSNEKAGYVVRKILRRAARDGHDLGIEGSFLHQMVDLIGKVMGEAYPEVLEHAGQCRSLIRAEEEGFATVYRRGMQRLERYLASAGSRGSSEPLPGSGAFAFELHDTYGFPVDISDRVMADAGIILDMSEFESAMTEQQALSRQGTRIGDAVFAESASSRLRQIGVEATRFVGYDRLVHDARITGLLDDEQRIVAELPTSGSGFLIVSESPFYAEGGGQVGDSGRVESGSATATVETTTQQGGYHLHRIRVVHGVFETGASVRLQVDEDARRATERNHTATHLLHAALKSVLGAHVSQAGSVVEPARLRFDFTQPERPSEQQLAQIEEIVNEQIVLASPVEDRICAMDEARRAGFVALFGEKYGDEVRTLSIGEFSRELCGGTHVRNTGAIGSFRIVAEGAISAGTRRIEAVTGLVAVRAARMERNTLHVLARNIKVPVDELGEKIEALLADNKRLRRELERALAKDVGQIARELEGSLIDGVGGRSLLAEVPGLQMKELQDLLVRLQQRLAPLVGVVLSVGQDGVLVGATVAPELTGRIAAGTLVQELTGCMGGGGGGRPEMAQGKGRDAARLAEARAKAASMLVDAGLRSAD